MNSIYFYFVENLEKPRARIERRRNTTIESRPIIDESDDSSDDKPIEPTNKRRRPERNLDVSFDLTEFLPFATESYYVLISKYPFPFQFQIGL